MHGRFGSHSSIYRTLTYSTHGPFGHLSWSARLQPDFTGYSYCTLYTSIEHYTIFYQYKSIDVLREYHIDGHGPRSVSKGPCVVGLPADLDSLVGLLNYLLYLINI